MQRSQDLRRPSAPRRLLSGVDTPIQEEKLPATEQREVVLATIMRRVGGTGVQTHTSTFERYLQSSGRPATVINPFDARSPLVKPVFAVRYGIDPLSDTGSLWWYRHWHERYLRIALRNHLRSGQQDRVIYAQCPVSASAALRVRTHQPVVLAVHFNLSHADEWANDKGKISEGGRFYRSIREFEARVLSQVDGIVYVSDFMRGVLQHRLPALRAVPSVVIPNFVDLPHMIQTSPTRDIITVGALEPRKNHAYLLQVLVAAKRRGHRFSLTVVGEGPDRGRLQHKTEELGLSDQVRFVGYHPDPRRLMAEHRVYCHTSRMESFGIVLIEAMSVGLPVLAAPVGGVPEIVRPGIDGYLWDQQDPESAADRLISVLDTPGVVARLGTAARQRFTDEFSDRVIGARLGNFLAQTATRPRAVQDDGDAS